MTNLYHFRGQATDFGQGSNARYGLQRLGLVQKKKFRGKNRGIPSGHFWKSVATWLATVLELALGCLGLAFAFFNPCLQKVHE